MKNILGIGFCLSFLLMVLLIAPGCKTTSNSGMGPANSLDLRPGMMRVHMKASATSGSINLPWEAYVFPPLLVDRELQPVQELVPRTKEDGDLGWEVPGSQAALYKETVEEGLREAGFTPVDFGHVTGMTQDHAVLIINSYYSDAWTDPDREDVRLLFVRIIFSTYPVDLNPEGRLDLINQEAVCIYKLPANHTKAVRNAYNHLLRNLGFAGEFVRDISIRN